MQRNYKMDNIRFLLIFLVILGHFIELFQGDFSLALYKIIYSFHMPAFLFLTGFFARFHSRKIIFNLVCPYILFQILYRAFDAFIIQGKDSFSLNFTTPYWLLWYLLTVICYYLLIPLIDCENKRSRKLILGLAIAISLLAGFDSSIGRYGSLSRSFTFLPFFLAGYYLSKTKNKLPTNRLILPVSGMIAILCSFYIVNCPAITKNVLYGSYSYEKAGYDPLIKIILLVCGFAWVIFLLCAIPDKKIPFVSLFGRNTLSVFLLHGFIVRLAKKHGIFSFSETGNILLAIVLSLIMICLFGNPWVARLFHKSTNHSKTYEKGTKQ